MTFKTTAAIVGFAFASAMTVPTVAQAFPFDHAVKGVSGLDLGSGR
ncbi:MAG: hypothetical protein AAFU50_09460 [Pseudomonadota bacterium]